LAIIAVSGQVSAGASWSLFLPAAITLNISLVLIIAARGYGYKKYGWTDLVCLAGAVAAIVAWAVAKTRKEPFTESAISWFLVSGAACLAIISTTKFDVANLLYAVYTALIAVFIGCLAYFGQRKHAISIK